MVDPDALRHTRIPLTHGSGEIPAVGFGTLIPDPLATKQATKAALEVGFRHLDCAERHRNEDAVGDGTIQREDVFVTTKRWNTKHRPELVKPAFDASRRRQQLDCVGNHKPRPARPFWHMQNTDRFENSLADTGVALGQIQFKYICQIAEELEL